MKVAASFPLWLLWVFLMISCYDCNDCSGLHARVDELEQRVEQCEVREL